MSRIRMNPSEAHKRICNLIERVEEEMDEYGYKYSLDACEAMTFGLSALKEAALEFNSACSFQSTAENNAKYGVCKQWIKKN